MSGNKLAITTFSGGPDDALAVLDTYDKTDAGVVNSIKEVVDLTSQYGSLVPGFFDEAKKAILPNGGKKKAGDSQDDILGRLGNLGNDKALSGLLRGLSSEVKGGFNIGGPLGDIIKGNLGGTISKISTAGFGDALNLSKIVGSVTGGNFNLATIDLGAASGLISGLTAQGSALGLPKVFSSLATTFTDKGILGNAAMSLLPGIMKTGNLGMLQDISLTSIAKNLTSFAPDLIPTTISNFKMPEFMTGPKMTEFYDSVKTGLGSIDVDWNAVTRGAVTALSGTTVNKSDDFQKLIASKAFSQKKPIPASVAGAAPVMPVHNETEKFLMLMKGYKDKSVTDHLKDLIPILTVKPKPQLVAYDSSTFVPF